MTRLSAVAEPESYATIVPSSEIASDRSPTAASATSSSAAERRLGSGEGS
jgi:hypothetical protein